ncbi:MAG: site-specific integrase [Clostridium sp.]|nr:site-specific integrase [Clostridium sp.]
MTTKINYETYVHRHIKDTIGGYKLCDLSTVAIQQFYQEKAKNVRLDRPGGLSAKTLRNMHNMLHKALNQAVYLDMISKNPADFVVLPKKQKVEMRYFTVEEQQKLQEIIKGNRLEMPILLDLYTGLRQGELLGLPWKDVYIDLNGNSFIRVTQTLNRIKNTDNNSESKTILTINEPKTKHSVRSVPLLHDIAEKLDAYRKSHAAYLESKGFPNSEFVFTSTTGTPIDPRSFQRDFKKILVKNNIRIVNVHGLRHTFATRALESGMSTKTLSTILGHSSTAFTMDIYGHVTENLKNDEISKMKGFL